MTTQPIQLPDTDDDDIFARPPRTTAQPVTAIDTKVPTIRITCAVCGESGQLPVTYLGKVCHYCRAELPKTQEWVLDRWTQVQIQATDKDNMRYLNVVQERFEAQSDVLGRFLPIVHRHLQGEDTRLVGDSKRVQRILFALQHGQSDEEIIKAEQARVQKRVSDALANNDGLSDILKAEQAYHIAKREIEIAMDDAGLL
jgi:hypothetical protein